MVSKPSISALKESVSERVGSTESLTNDARAVGGSDMILFAISMVIGLTFLANALPPALASWTNNTPTGLGSGATAMWELIPLVVVAGITLFILGVVFSSDQVQNVIRDRM